MQENQGDPPGGGFGNPPSGGGFGPPPGGGLEEGPPPRIEPLAIASTVLGALSFFLCWCSCIGIPLAVGGAVTGAIALSKANQPGSHPTSKTLALIGLGLSIVILILDIASLFLGFGANYANYIEQMSRFR